MANVKITDLTELSAADSAAVDVFPIVDIDADATKKITIASLRTTVAFANDFATYATLYANINTVQNNVAAGVTESTAIEARRVANVAGAVSTITTGNLTTGRALISDGSGKVAVLASVTSTELGFLDATSSVQTQLDTKIATTASAANDFVTFTRLDANINIVSANTAAVEARRVANIAGAVSTITTADLTASRAVVSDGSGKVAVSAVTSTEIGYLDGVSSTIQTQINDIKTRATANASSSGAADAVEARRVANIAGAVSTITTGNLSASRAIVSDGSGKVAISAVTATEIGHLDGVTSTIQTQINTTNTNVADNSSRIAATVTETTAVEARRVANIAGAVSTIITGNLTASRAIVSDGSGKVAISAITATEIGHLDGVSSAIQTQINSKQATITGAATTIDDTNLTASRAVVSDGSGKVAVSAVTSTEIGYLDGVSSAIQTQLNTKAPLAGATFTGQVNMSDDLVVTGNLTVNGDTTTVNSENKIIQDRFIMLANAVSGAPSADVGIFFNRGTSGNAALYYDESVKFFTISETRDPDSNVAISPTGAANLAVGQFTATSVKYNGADLNTAITDNRSGAVSTVYKDNLTASRAVVSDGSGKVAVSAVTSTEIGYLDGVSSAIQTQINATNTKLTDNSSRIAATVTETTAVEARRVANIAGAVSTITTANLTGSRALASDGSGKLVVSAVTATELGHLDGVSSAIQTQIDSKAALAGSTFSGAIQLNAAFVQGVNDQGYDLKLFGDTAGAFLLWDTSADTLGVTGAAKIDITKDKLLIGGTAVTTTAAEVNLLDAITRGSIIYGNASGASARLAAGGADKILTSDGTDISWEDPAGGVEIRGYTTATTLGVAPGTTASDLGDLTDTNFDAFNVRTTPSYDLMEPVGSVISVDCGAF